MTRASLGVDVGGTFTDFALWDGRQLITTKSSTTTDQSQAVVEGSAGFGVELASIVHGTTVATNALLERRGADLVFITDAGFTDVPEIGRQDRPALYDSSVDRPEPLVSGPNRIGLGEDIDGAVGDVAAIEPQAVAVSLLYSYRDPDREKALGEALSARLPGAAVSLSSEVVGEFREYERASTTILNAYLAPEMSAYLQRLEDRARGAGIDADIAVMRSSGGLMSPREAGDLPAAALLSGPAGGVVAASQLGAAMGLERLISFDMGGTSTDVCRITGGEPVVSYERAIDGYPCRMPAVAVHTVGAGGGSIGWIDSGGALRVGPQSAGAHPGPAAYGRGGTAPTVTDANLMLGRLAPDVELAGGLVLDADLAGSSLDAVGSRIGLDSVAAARGIVEIVEEHMAAAIRHVTVEEGADPRDHVLVAFGGAGGLHASALAKSLGMAGLIVPAHAGVFSALGLLLSPPRIDTARSTLLTSGDGLDQAILERADEARRLAGTGASVESFIDVRYVGQSHEVTVTAAASESWDVVCDRFHAAHLDRNGFARRNDPVEVVTVRAVATGSPVLRWDDLAGPAPSGEARAGTRRIMLDEEVDADVWRREGLSAGDEVVGPAIITEAEATTVLLPGDRARLESSGALVVEW